MEFKQIVLFIKTDEKIPEIINNHLILRSFFILVVKFSMYYFETKFVRLTPGIIYTNPQKNTFT